MLTNEVHNNLSGTISISPYLIFAFVQAEINPFVWSWEIRGHMTFAWFLAFGGYVLYCILKGKDL